MLNFNHERFIAAVMSGRMARVCLEDAFNYAKQRVAFGKTLMEQPVCLTILDFLDFLASLISRSVSGDEEKRREEKRRGEEKRGLEDGEKRIGRLISNTGG